MPATVTLLPAAAVDRICHEEQLRIWAHDNIVGALCHGDWLRDDLSYDDQIELEQVLMQEVRRIVAMALGHPEARTVMTVSPGARKGGT